MNLTGLAAGARTPHARPIPAVNRRSPKRRDWWRRGVLAGWWGCLVLFTCRLGAADLPKETRPTQGSALLEVAGAVEVARGGKPPWRAAAPGQALEPGDQLRTRENSRALLRLSDRSTVRVHQRTTVEIQAPAAGTGRGRLRLREGSTYFLNRERPADVEFETPLATGAIRGTEFLVSADPEAGRDVVAMVDGRVALRHGTEEVEIAGGQQAVIEEGGSARVSPALPLTGLVQWSFHYPGVLSLQDLAFTAEEARALERSLAAYGEGDLAAAMDTVPADTQAKSPSTRAYLAALKLAFGQVKEARALLDDVPDDFPPAAALRTVIAAVTLADAPSSREPSTCSEHLAASYERQARFDLEAARAHAARAAELDRGSGFAWARLAELEYSHGRRAQTRQALVYQDEKTWTKEINWIVREKTRDAH